MTLEPPEESVVATLRTDPSAVHIDAPQTRTCSAISTLSLASS